MGDVPTGYLSRRGIGAGVGATEGATRWAREGRGGPVARLCVAVAYAAVSDAVRNARPSTRNFRKGSAVPAISRDEVAHLARLSRLALTDDELDQFAGQLDSILSHVRTISEVAAADVPATASPNPATNVTRPDVVVPGLTPNEALSGAPAVEEQRFMVPQILGEEE